MFCLSLTATTCLNDNPAGPGSAPLKLSIAAQISGQAENEWRVGIRVFYTRTTEAEVNLPVSPPEVFVERGVSTTRDVSVQIGSCLSDTERTNLERGGCTFIVELSLLDESGEVVTQDSKEVHAPAAGQTVSAPPFNLAQSFIVLAPASVSFSAVQNGQLPAQAIVLASSSTGASLGTLSTVVTYLSGSGWLVSTPSPTQIALRPNNTALPPATYEATVRVISTNEDHPDRVLPVQYTVTAAAATGSISGAIRNAQTGGSILGASVELRLGANNTSGTPITTVQSGAGGAYNFTSLQAGTYTVLAKATGFADGNRGSIVVGTGAVTNQDVILSATLGAGQTRIVLTWGRLPPDLDAHLTGPTQNQDGFHICWINRGNAANSPFAFLDNDEVGGFGPETITISQQITGTYRFYVYDFTNGVSPTSTPLSESGARVQVFRGNALVNDFSVPSGAGTLWTVFTLSGTTVTPVNTLTTTTLGTNCGTLPSGDGSMNHKGQ